MIQRSLDKKRSGQGGFTLVELLIVIVILGILAAIVVLAIGGLKGTSEKAACNAGVKTIESAEDAYVAVSDGFPTPTDVARYGDITALRDVNGAAGRVLKTVPDGLTVAAINADVSYEIHGTGSCDGIGNGTGIVQEP